MDEKAYKCLNESCECHHSSGWMLHCPLCGQLYLLDPMHPDEPCADCETSPNNQINQIVRGNAPSGE